MAFYNVSVVALGGAFGATVRFWLSGAIARRIGEIFPWGTLVVNVSGAIVIGAAAAGLPSGAGAQSLWRLAIMTGFLGGYTTVSSFALQTLNLARLGEAARAAANVAASVVLCIAGAWAGFVSMNFMAG